MVVLTGFRMKNITKTIESLNASSRPWKLWIIAAWLFSFFLGIVPMLPQASQYFLHNFSYSSPFQNGSWYTTNLEQFAYRLSALSNTTIKFTGNKFQSVKRFVAGSFPNEAFVKLFGYYGETSVCIKLAQKQAKTFFFLCLFCKFAIMFFLVNKAQKPKIKEKYRRLTLVHPLQKF